MKCVFTVTSNDPKYHDLAKVLVATARLNSNVELCCLYDGQEDEFTSWLSRWGVHCYIWKVSFLEDIRRTYTGKKSLEFCAGTYLRTEIPNAFQHYGLRDEYVLFLDVDTMVLNRINLNHIKPTYFAAAPDWDIADWSLVGTGVMLINLVEMRKNYSKLIGHLMQHDFDFSFDGAGPCSQGAWNTFFRGRWDKLNPLYDWKPWWGFNLRAKIVHFSGPKPEEVPLLLGDQIDEGSMGETQKIHHFVVNQDKNSFLRYSSIWKEYREISKAESFSFNRGKKLFQEQAKRKKL